MRSIFHFITIHTGNKMTVYIVVSLRYEYDGFGDYDTYFNVHGVFQKYELAVRKKETCGNNAQIIAKDLE